MIMDHKYEEALKRARKGMPIDEVFPELKESEDERIRKALIRMLSAIDGGYPFEKYGILKKDALSYLERKKEHFRDDTKMVEQKPAEWSEEDEFFRQQLIIYCENCVQDTLAAKCVDWLKSLRPQPISQSNTNHTIWHNASEEKPTKLPIIHIWYHGNRVNTVVAHENIGLQEELDDINFQPDDKWAYVEDLLNVQPHWKPSVEQIEALKDVINRALLTCRQQVQLESLYNDLQKLL